MSPRKSVVLMTQLHVLPAAGGAHDPIARPAGGAHDPIERPASTHTPPRLLRSIRSLCQKAVRRASIPVRRRAVPLAARRAVHQAARRAVPLAARRAVHPAVRRAVPLAARPVGRWEAPLAHHVATIRPFPFRVMTMLRLLPPGHHVDHFPRRASWANCRSA